ncbi:hypothetical protein [Pseudomonas sp. C9-3]|uniref:hypothetical protein n=1 Tax=Pseudomonas sp. C9-3 TaxID=3078264 RepID=UPI0028EADC8B|nr:hypothetical protein [Pseudomonas sp. C9-3]
MKGSDIRTVEGEDSSVGAKGRDSSIKKGMLLALPVIFFVAAFYLLSNISAPMQRDGAHFVFMANNIAHGLPPYWASFETKNPLVEIFWSLFIFVLAKSQGILESVRIAETIWIASTATLIFLTIFCVSLEKKPKGRTLFGSVGLWSGLSVALLYLVLALDVRVTDDGLNIALYQGLPELLLIVLLLRLPSRHHFIHGGAVGVVIFLSWFVKQTSLLPEFLVIAGCAVVLRGQLRLSWWGGCFLGAVGGVAAFALHLLVTGTLDNYLLGSTIYRSGIAPALMSEFWSNALASYSVPIWSLSFGQFLSVHRIWTTIALVILIPVAMACLYRSRERAWSGARLALLLSILWMFGAWLQAVLALTFFPHYFLSSLAPVALVSGVLISMARRPAALALSAGVLGLFFGLIGSYADMKESNMLRGELAPINISTAQVLRFIKPGDRVFNWSGLPHVLVAYGAPSSYALNMNWPFIMTGLPDDTKKRMLRNVLRVPPDVVVAMYESYPKNQGIANYAMNESVLKEVTGLDYVLVYRSSTLPGRYGDAVSVFRMKTELNGIEGGTSTR